MTKQFGEDVFAKNNPILNIKMDNQILFSQKWMGLLHMSYISKESLGNTYFYREKTSVDMFCIRIFPKYSM